MLRKIAGECLDQRWGPDRDHFGPDVVRELELTRGLNGRIQIKRHDRYVRGTLKSFILPLAICSFAPFPPYTLVLRTDPEEEQLPIMYVPICGEEWYSGSAGVQFLP